MEILMIVICILIAIAIFLVILFRPKPSDERILLSGKIDALHSNINEDFRANREEITAISKDNRSELNNTLKDFKSELSQTLRNITEQTQNALKEVNNTLTEKVDSLISRIDENNKSNREALTGSLKDFTLEQRNKFDELKQEQKDLTEKTGDQLEKITGKVEEKLNTLNDQAKTDNSQLREALGNAFKGFQETFDKNVASFNELQKEKFAQLETRQNDLVKATETKLETIRTTVEEKLEKTLSERLGQSFETVGKQLIEVQKGLGEMQTIASDVGGLKKVLSNVKLRGGVGEVQLAMLLEQILAPSQYDANVRTKVGSMEPVEFAIKLPGKSEDENSFVYLPIDAKFPKDAYEHLITAYENAIPDDIEAATKNLEATIRKMARDIRDKYIDPPNTTDFAILFLPFESIYAEVIRRSALVDQLRDEFKITVAGPTTLAALLNSLQMGFRTLALQKRSSEVWQVLGGVKTEFEKFGGLLEKAQKNIQTGLGQLEDVVGTRTRAIQRQLRNVETLPATDEKNILPEIMEDELETGT
ncbi:DNA recombination protein RmuC [Terrimonas pollutisoli]|uniref:DNA recombination protein RmuC n=1 Tax=Terrimonas pollutisoli TaxID=3034147 RepID=UPI0023ED3E3E|nr:DNA recombination protein RmuC [Terrimonas sp. H1YJ31]